MYSLRHSLRLYPPRISCSSCASPCAISCNACCNASWPTCSSNNAGSPEMMRIVVTERVNECTVRG
jgi:hypothetical protein